MLIADHEPEFVTQLRGLPADYTNKMLNAITAFEIDIVAVH
jgi:hypothetical protein